MTNREIFNCAVSLLGLCASTEGLADLEERSPYILASFCCSAKEIDASLRKAESAEAQKGFSKVFLALESEFPLSESLAHAASLYLAAMLMIDENSELSDSLYDKYCSAMAELEARLG